MELHLSEDDMAYLEELYVPHKSFGMAKGGKEAEWEEESILA